jgi:hypothetical protein
MTHVQLMDRGEKVSFQTKQVLGSLSACRICEVERPDSGAVWARLPSWLLAGTEPFRTFLEKLSGIPKGVRSSCFESGPCAMQKRRETSSCRNIRQMTAKLCGTHFENVISQSTRNSRFATRHDRIRLTSMADFWSVTVGRSQLVSIRLVCIFGPVAIHGNFAVFMLMHKCCQMIRRFRRMRSRRDNVRM